MRLGKPSKIDMAHMTVLAVPVVLVAVLALLGFPPAVYALPFLAGALLGSAAARLMTLPASPRGVQAVAIFMAALSLIVAGLVLISPVSGLNWFSALGQLGDKHTALGLFIGGFTFLFLTEILRRVALPSLYPSTLQEGQQQKREQLREILIIGGIVLALIIGASAIFGVLALIAYMVGQFSS